jgi:hypothetical protein
MKALVLIGFASIIALAGCRPMTALPTPQIPGTATGLSGSATTTPPPALTETLTNTTPVTPLPPVEGPDPSTWVAAFYYPWYGNPATDGEGMHWTQNRHLPPQDIASDYYHELGPSSSNDPAVVAQHMAWLREAGIGVLIVSWWGQASREEKPVPLIFQMAKRYGIKVTFHIEPYNGRTGDGLVADIKYLYPQ